MMHTGYAPNPTVIHPSFGSYCSVELGEKLENFDLPHFMQEGLLDFFKCQ